MCAIVVHIHTDCPHSAQTGYNNSAQRLCCSSVVKHAVFIELTNAKMITSQLPWLRIGGHWHGHQGSPRASVLCVLNKLRRIFQSIAWCRQSSVSVVFLGVFFQQRCHVERECRDYPLEPRGRSTVVFSSWLLPGSDVSVSTLLILS